MVDLSTLVPMSRNDQPESLEVIQDVPSSSIQTREKRFRNAPIRYVFDNVNLFSLNPFVSLVGCALCGFAVSTFWPGVVELAAKKNPGRWGSNVQYGSNIW